MNNKADFIYWYFNEFQLTELYTTMATMVENSPWHRERNVATHTDMVVAQYITSTKANWDHDDLMGAFACAFHDVGKPAACREKYSDTRGDYKSFPGHELISARLWENWAVTNYATLTGTFFFTAADLFRVGWIIEKHLPWAIRKEEKRYNLALTGVELFGMNGPVPYTNMVLADTYGRISDDYLEKRAKSHEWVFEYNILVEQVIAKEASKQYDNESRPTLYMPIAASGSGKSTAVNNLKSTYSDTLDVFSLDALRMEWYVEGKNIASAEDPYAYAFTKACEDKTFKSRANQRFIEMTRDGNDLVVDNLNLSKKRRRWFITEARKRGYQTTAMLLPVTLDTILERQASRSDKTVPEEAVRQHYTSLQLPEYGEFDEIRVIGTNLR